MPRRSCRFPGPMRRGPQNRGRRERGGGPLGGDLPARRGAGRRRLACGPRTILRPAEAPVWALRPRLPAEAAGGRGWIHCAARPSSSGRGATRCPGSPTPATPLSGTPSPAFHPDRRLWSCREAPRWRRPVLELQPSPPPTPFLSRDRLRAAGVGADWAWLLAGKSPATSEPLGKRLGGIHEAIFLYSSRPCPQRQHSSSHSVQAASTYGTPAGCSPAVGSLLDPWSSPGPECACGGGGQGQHRRPPTGLIENSRRPEGPLSHKHPVCEFLVPRTLLNT